MSDQHKTTAWHPIETAPLDGSCIWGRTQGGFELLMSWSDGFSDGDGNPCGCWVAWLEDQHPACWTDAICWAENEDCVPSDPPTHWRQRETVHA